MSDCSLSVHSAESRHETKPIGKIGDKSAADITTIIHFDGILHRFNRTELKPVNFGKKEDVSLLLLCFLVSFIFFHLLGLIVGLLVYKKTLQDMADEYLANRILMTGFLCTCWFLGYNLVSYAIWTQFESALERDAPPDDFEFVDTGENAYTDIMGTRSSYGLGNDAPAGDAQMASQTLLVTMPSGELVIGTNTRSHSLETLQMINKNPK